MAKKVHYLEDDSFGEIFESTWSDKVANDPKHRPQFFDRLSTTVRKEWCRRPQEAHIADGDKYRRLSVDEIAVIQGFDPAWVKVNGLTENEMIAVLGNAVAPPVAKAIGSVLEKSGFLSIKSSIEICAGIGGLSVGFPYLMPIAKIEMWDVACKVLRSHFNPDVIVEGKAQDYDFSAWKGKVGLLCGGPPCQPWSQAGMKLGQNDPRDVMGFTPSAVAACEPEAFIFENVPGLLSSTEHAEYRDDLWRRLRNPKPGLFYGLDFKIINAADYGVPQHRRRVFIVGIKNQPDAKARRFLSDVAASSTYHDPDKPAYQKKPWVSLREALKGVNNDHPWRKWNINASEGREEIVDAGSEATSSSSSIEVLGASQAEVFDPMRIGFWWNKKNYSLLFHDDRWTFQPRTAKRNVRAIIFDEKIGAGDGSGPCNIAVHGDYMPSIEALSPILKGTVKFVYWDMPRLDSDGEFAQHTETGFARSAWMSLLRDVSRASHSVLAHQGFIAVQTEEESIHYARMVLDETFGHDNHITTFAWEKKYSAQNDRATPTDSFDFIVVYSTTSRDSITEKIGPIVNETKIIDDGDPRGCYTAGHKGARSGSEKTKFKVNVPPYHWRITTSSLPVCDWYVFDSITGVLHIHKVKQSGNFHIDVECEDAKGNKAKGRTNFTIKERRSSADIWTEPDSVGWLIKDVDSPGTSGGEIRIETSEGDNGFVGSDYSLILLASGGVPFVGKTDQPGAGRYWEMGQSTLVSLVVRAAASFGKKGLSLPSEKKFMDRSDTTKRISVRNWLPWYIGGKSEDATRHLQNLAKIGYGKVISKSFAKPEPLCHYLIQLFAPNPDDTVLSIGDGYATMTSAAIKSGRIAVHLIGPSKSDVSLWEETALPRIRCVQEKKDVFGICTPPTDPDDEPFEQAEPRPLWVSHLSVSSVVKKGHSDISFEVAKNENYESFVAALRGFFPDQNSPSGFSDLNGNHCLVISPEEILDEIRVSEAESMIPADANLTILFERSEISDDYKIPQRVVLIRVPFEVE